MALYPIYKDSFALSSPGYQFQNDYNVQINPNILVSSQQSDGVYDNLAGSTLSNFGRVFGEITSGVFVDQSANNATVINQASGLIIGYEDAIDLEAIGDKVTNFGEIIGGIFLDAFSDKSTIVNSGSLYGHENGIDDLALSGSLTVVNSGKIYSDHVGISIESFSASATITNTTKGLISSGGQAAIIHGLGGTMLLNNNGTIDGDINCAVPGGHDVINNHGKINGTVRLLGDDVFKGKGGTSGEILCGAGNDHVAAGKGNLKIDVGSGNSTLSGGQGHDQFIFDSALVGQFDKITNFRLGVDKIALSEAVFAGLGPHGTLSASHFHLGAAVNGRAQIDYFQSTGVLEYCSHGNFGPADHFATLSNHPGISASDFDLVVFI
jgi:Ca2+-binding RTX toxin-like protein